MKEQNNVPGFKHYLIRDISHKRTTIGIDKLDKLAYRSREPEPIIKEATSIHAGTLPESMLCESGATTVEDVLNQVD
ncbi:hypothetical protein FACS189472_16390 [Alphaproteobacteria bacterium]|nr:hypothetical protein FACS189472_16390 [Alphaproteobacteria bacterium]